MQGKRHRSNTKQSAELPVFEPAVQFLSVAAPTAADRAAGGGEPIKISVQRESGRRGALQRGVGIVKEFTEIGAQKSLRTRPVLRRLLAYLNSHPDIRYIIYTGTCHYARSSPLVEVLSRHFQRLGVGVLVSESDTQPDKLRLWESVR
ncbi:recombinase family protein [Nocardia aurea]|uniref:recombinase family protein n=1 Tax=Nocardia aurea TaxID=2144174 RepID=UPI000D6882C5|nr:recombinase family protein [Nocardia aurea]